MEVELRALKANPPPTDANPASVKRFYNNLRTQLVEEIERLERSYNEREDDLVTDSDGRQIEADSLKRSLNEVNELTAGMEASYDIKIQELELQRESEVRRLQEELNSEIARTTKCLEGLKECKAELKSTYIHAKMQEKTQADTVEDKGKVVDEIKKIHIHTKEKIEESNERLKATEFQFTEELRQAEQKYGAAFAERRTLELRLKVLTTASHERTQHECVQLRNALKTLLAAGGLKETRVRILAGELAKELLELQRAFEQRECDLAGDSEKVAMERGVVESEVDDVYVGLKKFVISGGSEEVYEEEKKELKVAVEQLEEKTAELGELRAKDSEGFLGSRKQLTKTLDDLNAFIKESTVNDVKFSNDVQELLGTIRETDDVHTNVEESTNTQIINLNNELKKLKLEVRTLNAKDYDTKIAELETFLAKAQQELSVSKKILAAHVDTIAALEERIKLKGPTDKFNKDDEMVRVKMEALRLNTENKALQNAKQRLETHYTSQIQALNERYMKKTEDYEAIMSRFNNLNDSVASKAEELRAWQKRSENLRAAVAALEGETADLSLKNAEVAKFRGQDDELYMEENKGLKEEVEKAQKEWEAKQQNWEHEKRLMRDEVAVLKEKAEVTDVVVRQMTELLEEKARLADLKAESLKAVEETYHTTVEGLKHSTQAVIDWIGKEEIMKRADEESMRMLKQHAERLERLIEETNEGHSKEVAAVTAGYHAKLAILNEKKSNGLFEVESLKEQVKLYRDNLARLKRIHETELKLKALHANLIKEFEDVVITKIEKKKTVVTSKSEKSSPKTPSKTGSRVSPKSSPKKELKRTNIKLNKMHK